MPLMVGAIIVCIYAVTYLAIRKLGYATHYLSWEFDPLGANEESAPAIHRVYFAGRVNGIVQMLFVPAVAAEEVFWKTAKPRIHRNDPVLLTPYRFLRDPNTGH